jgi:hypothetical protein
MLGPDHMMVDFDSELSGVRRQVLGAQNTFIAGR